MSERGTVGPGSASRRLSGTLGASVLSSGTPLREDRESVCNSGVVPCVLALPVRVSLSWEEVSPKGREQ